MVQLGYLAFESGDSVAGLRWAAMLEEASSSQVYPEIIRLLALARAGDLRAVVRLIESRRDVYQRDWQYSLWIGRALAMAGDRDAALSWLENSADRGCYDLAMLERSQDLAGLRALPRFRGVAAVVGARSREIARLATLAGYR